VQREVELQMERPCAKTEAPSERAQRFANLLMLSYEPMLAWSLDGAIEFWNAGAEQLYGFSPNDARQLGNFPQAFSHLALIGTALSLHDTGPAQQRGQGAKPGS
jgi:PAS domain-containing protein